MGHMIYNVAENSNISFSGGATHSTFYAEHRYCIYNTTYFLMAFIEERSI